MELLAPRSKVQVEPEGFEFHAVVRRTSQRLFRLALRITGNDADASDVLQEGYLRAFRAIGRLRGRPSAELDAWLYAVVTHAALNWLRDRKRASHRERGAGTPEPPDAQGMLEARDVLRKLQALLDRLPPEQRVALVLKELEGKSAREVAGLLGITEGALEQRLVRARETLRAGGLR